MKVYRHDAGHMTKMAAMPIYGKNSSKIFFSGNGGPIPMKLGMWHQGLKPIIVYTNDDPGLTLTLIYGTVKFGYLGYSIGKSENSGFFRNYC